MEPLKGLILSGGKGTRLRPITHTSAKQLVPVANKPVLFYGIEAMAEAGIEQVGIIIAPETGAEIERVAGDGSRFGVSISYILQDEPLGLAHAVLTAEPFLGASPFVMYLGDNLLQGGISDLVAAFVEHEPDALILLTPVADPEHYGVAELDDGRVVALLDWELASIGPAEMDLAWYLVLDELVAGFVERTVPGFVDRDASIRFYERALGRQVAHLAWHEIFALARSIAINDRQARLAAAAGTRYPGVAGDANPMLAILADRITAFSPVTR